MGRFVLFTAIALLAGCSGTGGDDDDDTTTRDAGTTGSRDAGSSDRDGGIVDQTCNPNFGMADACGGDLDGTWSYQAACATSPLAAAITDYCDTATIQADRFEGGTGMLTIGAGAFNLGVTVTIHVEATVPIACTQGFGCAAAEQAIELGFNGVDAVCTTAGTDCSCTVDGPVATASQGSVTTSAGVATVNGTDTYYYCVTGSKLEYRRFDDGDNPVFVLTR